MKRIEASNHDTYNNPEYLELDKEDTLNRDQVDDIVEKEDKLDLELQAIDPSHETINERQIGNRK